MWGGEGGGVLLSTQAVLCVGIRRRRRGAAKYTNSTLCGEKKEEGCC